MTAQGDFDLQGSIDLQGSMILTAICGVYRAFQRLGLNYLDQA